MFLQPGLFQVGTLHLVYTDDAARTDLGYVSCVDSLRGLVDSVLEWNGRVEGKMGQEVGERGKGKGQMHRKMVGQGGGDGDGVRKRGDALSKVSAVKA